MTKVLVKALDNPASIAYERMFGRYGTNCSLGQISDEGQSWIANFDVNVPVEVRDDKRDRHKIFSINVEDVGKIRIRKEDMKVVEAPSLLTVEKKIHDHRVNLRKAVEIDLLKIAHSRFGQIDAARISLSPIYTTLTNILQQKYPGRESILRSGYMPQVQLLEELGYVKRQMDLFAPSDKLVELRRQTDSDATAIGKVLGLVLAEKFDFLVDNLRITQFLPFVRLSTTYYSEAVQFGELISVSEDSLRDSYFEYYRTASEKRLLRYAPIIDELVKVEILSYDGDFISGEQSLLAQLRDDLAGQLPQSRDMLEPV
jgi:hypothetical protein